MSPKIAANAIAFLARANLSGTEVTAYNEVVAALTVIAEQPEVTAHPPFTGAPNFDLAAQGE